jgi:hypothetical protein
MLTKGAVSDKNFVLVLEVFERIFIPTLPK